MRRSAERCTKPSLAIRSKSPSSDQMRPVSSWASAAISKSTTAKRCPASAASSIQRSTRCHVSSLGTARGRAVRALRNRARSACARPCAEFESDRQRETCFIRVDEALEDGRRRALRVAKRSDPHGRVDDDHIRPVLAPQFGRIELELDLSERAFSSSARLRRTTSRRAYITCRFSTGIRGQRGPRRAGSGRISVVRICSAKSYA